METQQDQEFKASMPKDMSTDDLHSALRSAVSKDLKDKGKTDTYPSIHKVYPLANELVYHDGDNLVRRGFTVDSSGAATLGDDAFPVKHRDAYDRIATVTMAVFSIDDEYTHLEGPIFAEGDYADKEVTITETDIKTIAANSQRSALKIEHIETPLDEAFEESGIYSAHAKIDPKDGLWKVFARVRIPTLLDKLLTKAMGEAPRKVSIGLSPGKDRITELSLVRNPRVEDAALSACFSQFAAERGKNSAAPGAKDRRKTTMNKPPLKERLTALFSGKKKTLEEADIDPSEVKDIDFSALLSGEPGETKKLDPNVQAALDQLNAGNSALATQFGNRLAEQFADDAIKDDRFLPGDRDMLIRTFGLALAADNGGAIKFSAAGTVEEGANCKAIREEVAKRPKHTLTRSMAGGTLVFASPERPEAERAKEERSTYFSGSSTGKQVLEADASKGAA